MTDLRNQRRMAASVLKCGVNRVWIDSDRNDEIAKAVTRGDIRTLIRANAIQSRQIKGISRGRRKHVTGQRQKGRRKGYGSREGAKYARLSRKERWIHMIRSIRSYLRQLRDEKKIDQQTYRIYYKKASGGEFRSKDHLKTHLIADGLIMEEVKQQ